MISLECSSQNFLETIIFKNISQFRLKEYLLQYLVDLLTELTTDTSFLQNALGIQYLSIKKQFIHLQIPELQRVGDSSLVISGCLRNKLDINNKEYYETLGPLAYIKLSKVSNQLGANQMSHIYLELSERFPELSDGLFKLSHQYPLFREF